MLSARMEYCPEIALLHGAFACIEVESKAGKYDPLRHTKGDRSSRPYGLIRDVVREITSGLEGPRSQQEQKTWHRRLHHILFCKAFVFSSRFGSSETGRGKRGPAVMRFRAWCLPIPDFHPYLFFALSQEFGWAEFLGEMLAASDLPTALTFTTHSLAFCDLDPALPYDLHLLSATLDLLLCVVLCEAAQASWSGACSVAEPAGAQSDNAASADAGDGPWLPPSPSLSLQEWEGLEKTCLQLAAENQRRTAAAEGMGRCELVDCEELVSDEDKKTGAQAVDATSQPASVVDKKTRGRVAEVANQLMVDKLLQRVDQTAHDHLTQIADLLTEALRLVRKRLSTKLFDRSSCRKDAMAAVLPILGHILGLLIGFCALSLSNKPSHQGAARCLENWLLKEEDEQPQFGPDSGGSQSRLETEAPPGDRNETVSPDTDTSQGRSETEPSPCNRKASVSLVAGAFVALLRTPQTRTACVKCLRSFFAVQTAKAGSSCCKLSKEKAVKFGRVLKLNLRLCGLPRPLRVVRVVQSLWELLAAGDDDDGDDEDDDGAGMELRGCMSSIATELQKRERVAEEKQRNPSLAEVMDKVQKRLPRWDWYLQYGLAKRDVKDWWLAGFLEFLLKHASLLRKESDLKHLLSVLRLISHAAHESRHTDMCAQLVSRAFSQLPTSVQEQILLETFRDDQWSGFLPASHFEQALTVAFNKLSATASHKNLCDILPLALHDLLTFTHHAVCTAVASEGQIPVIVKVLGLIPAVMRSAHPLHHPSPSPSDTLLCGCVRAVLHGRPLDSREQKNCLRLVSALVKPVEATDSSQQPPLLRAAEFLSSCVLPYITLHHASETPPPISAEFALRLLIGCLEATLCVGFSDWLGEVPVPVVVACCAAMLQDCVGMVGEDRGVGVERALVTKVLLLDALGGLLQHLSSSSGCAGDGGLTIEEGGGLGWLQERCCDHHWTVCAYLAPFLAPSDSMEPNTLIAGYVREAMKSASENPSALLQLCAVSDSAAQQVTQAIPEDLHIPQVPLTIALAQVLPHLLVREVQRVVQVLTVLVDSGCVRMDLHHPSLLHSSALHFSATGRETGVAVCGLLTEAVLVVVCQEHRFTDPLLHHLSLILVAALQWLLECPQNNEDGTQTSERTWLQVAMFHQVCALMSVSPAIMLDPLFVVLLDLLTSVSQPESGSQDTQSPGKLRDVLVRGIALIPGESLRDTLHKKLNHQTV